MHAITRREALAALPVAVACARSRADAPKPIPLGFSLYGMKIRALAGAFGRAPKR